ncbi:MULTISPECIES: MotA/TolQ/ExbB proton channel family protein [unclassified Bacteroides]|uniref:MotA/TolQ/ExbB proton channel family protein n=1 Tax=unclassified Bacteroides TaxID=2646097 RepID=UPI0004E21984|nr:MULTISPECIES: MotA/TolQ/ExbB proton channel family protein [unclassified Bacteroides]
MEIISDILYWISTGLLVPVIVALILLFLRSLLLIGSFFGQYLAIRKSAAQIRKALTGISSENIDSVTANLPKKSDMLVVSFVKKMIESKDNYAEVKRLLAEFEIAADKDIATCKMLSKLGPMLGLMGTLIPMGPALAGLASGDIESMARNMQVAFATTVTGLVAAAIGYVTQQVKQRWYLQDMTNLEYLSDILKK